MNNGQSSNNAGGSTGNPQNIGTPNLTPQNNQLQGSGTNSSSDVITIPRGNSQLPTIPLSGANSSQSAPAPAATGSDVNGWLVGLVIVVAVGLIAASMVFAQKANKTSLLKR